jgi:hypothetical protein
MDAIIKEMYSFGTCFLFVKKFLVFGPYRPEKEILYFNKNDKTASSNFKQIDRHGPRPLLNVSHLAGSPPFSLYSTFKYTDKKENKFFPQI